MRLEYCEQSRNTTHLITNDIADLCCQFVFIIIILGNVSCMQQNIVSSLRALPSTQPRLTFSSVTVRGTPFTLLFPLFIVPDVCRIQAWSVLRLPPTL